MNRPAASVTQLDVADVVPQARHLHPVELVEGNLLFATSGALQAIIEIAVFQDGRIVSAQLDDRHRVWFWNDEPIVAVLPRAEVPTVTVYQRVFDPDDESGWAYGNPRVMETETETLSWEPDDGNPITWALSILNDHGTVEPSSSPPFTERTWYSHTGVDFARSGTTVDTSSHLSGFTRAEVEQIGQRVTARPAPATSSPTGPMDPLYARRSLTAPRPALGISR